ncbi:MAG: hypothetical protein QM487_15800, partial [Candidatus Marithrix sp.]
PEVKITEIEPEVEITEIEPEVEITEIEPEVEITTETNITNTLPIYNISSTKPCPEINEIHTYCTFKNREIGDIFIAENASVSGGILIGTMINEGRASNITITENGILIGGIVTGYIENKGIMADFIFVGASITGGILQGTIYNYSDIYNINLAADTYIIGGKLHGYIIGDPEYPAMLETLIIKKGSYLENVIIANDVIFEDRVTIGDNVVFLP